MQKPYEKRFLNMLDLSMQKTAERTVISRKMTNIAILQRL